jgi:hypothetical protein
MHGLHIVAREISANTIREQPHIAVEAVAISPSRKVFGLHVILLACRSPTPSILLLHAKKLSDWQTGRRTHSHEGPLRFREQPLHVGGLCDIAFDSNGLTAVGFDVGDNAVCVLLAGRSSSPRLRRLPRSNAWRSPHRCPSMRRLRPPPYPQIAHWNSSRSPLQSPSWDVCRNMNSRRYRKGRKPAPMLQHVPFCAACGG